MFYIVERREAAYMPRLLSEDTNTPELRGAMAMERCAGGKSCRAPRPRRAAIKECGARARKPMAACACTERCG